MMPTNLTHIGLAANKVTQTKTGVNTCSTSFCSNSQLQKARIDGGNNNVVTQDSNDRNNCTRVKSCSNSDLNDGTISPSGSGIIFNSFDSKIDQRTLGKNTCADRSSAKLGDGCKNEISETGVISGGDHDSSLQLSSGGNSCSSREIFIFLIAGFLTCSNNLNSKAELDSSSDSAVTQLSSASNQCENSICKNDVSETSNDADSSGLNVNQHSDSANSCFQECVSLQTSNIKTTTDSTTNVNINQDAKQTTSCELVEPCQNLNSLDASSSSASNSNINQKASSSDVCRFRSCINDQKANARISEGDNNLINQGSNDNNECQAQCENSDSNNARITTTISGLELGSSNSKIDQTTSESNSCIPRSSVERVTISCSNNVNNEGTIRGADGDKIAQQSSGSNNCSGGSGTACSDVSNSKAETQFTTNTNINQGSKEVNGCHDATCGNLNSQDASSTLAADATINQNSDLSNNCSGGTCGNTGSQSADIIGSGPTEPT